MNLIKLSESDIGVILEVQKGFSDGYSENQIKSAFSSGRFHVFLAQENGENAGFICFSVAMDESDIETVFVKSEFRRRGIAKSLIKKAESFLLDLAVKKVFLEVRENNIPAKSLYQDLGYNKISVRKGYYSDGENATIMAKELL